jgi:hypothetical protein
VSFDPALISLSKLFVSTDPAFVHEFTTRLNDFAERHTSVGPRCLIKKDIGSRFASEFFSASLFWLSSESKLECRRVMDNFLNVLRSAIEVTFNIEFEQAIKRTQRRRKRPYYGNAPAAPFR